MGHGKLTAGINSRAPLGVSTEGVLAVGTLGRQLCPWNNGRALHLMCPSPEGQRPSARCSQHRRLPSGWITFGRPAQECFLKTVEQRAALRRRNGAPVLATPKEDHLLSSVEYNLAVLASCQMRLRCLRQFCIQFVVDVIGEIY